MDIVITLSSACVGAAVTSALHFVIPRIQARKHENGDGNGSSGKKSVSFWENKMTDIVEEGVGRAFRGRNEQIRGIFREENEPLYENLRKMVDKQDAMLEKMNEILIEVIKRS